MAIFVPVRCVKFGAVAMAAMVACGLVTATPDRHGLPTIRNEAAHVQLQAVAVSTQVAALANTPGTSNSLVASAEGPAQTQASAVGTTEAVTAIATAAIALAAIPLWYLAFPVTLPVSVIGGIALFNLSSFWAVVTGAKYDPIAYSLIGAAMGLGFFAVGLPIIAVSAISSLFAVTDPYYPAAAQRSASTVTQNEASISVITDPMPEVDQGEPGSATEAVASSSKREQRATQRATTTAVVATDPAEAIPSINPTTATTDTTTTTVDEPVVLTRPRLASEVANTSAASEPQESAPPTADLQSTGRRNAVAAVPSERRLDASTRRLAKPTAR